MATVIGARGHPRRRFDRGSQPALYGHRHRQFHRTARCDALRPAAPHEVKHQRQLATGKRCHWIEELLLGNTVGSGTTSFRRCPLTGCNKCYPPSGCGTGQPGAIAQRGDIHMDAARLSGTSTSRQVLPPSSEIFTALMSSLPTHFSPGRVCSKTPAAASSRSPARQSADE